MALISKRQKTTIGLDVGSFAVKAVEVREGASGPEIVRVGMRELPPGAIVDGEPMDRDAVLAAITELFEENEIENRETSSAICGRSVIIKKIKMEDMDDETAAEVMAFEAEQYVPFEKEELCVDFEILQRGLPNNSMEVLLVAAKRDKVLSHIQLLREANLVPLIIDVDTFAVQNAFELNYEYEEGKVYALVDVGLSATNIGIIRDGIPMFNRDIAVGGETFLEGLQRRLGVTSDEAKASLEGVPGAKNENILAAIEAVGEDLGVAIERSFSYLRSSGEAESVDKIFLSGGGARISGLQSFLGEKLGMEVNIANPLKNVGFQDEIFGMDPIAVSPSLMVAIGLAIRKGS
jgi:type IV pilus assembly protein PilM